MADDYTPDEGHMSVAWVEYDDAAGDINEAEAEFDRFIAKVKRDAAREALDGLAVTYRDVSTLGILQYRDTHYPEETP